MTRSRTRPERGPRRLRLRWAALLVAATACGRPTPPVDANVLLVSIDTLRASRVGAYGNTDWGASPTPRADALADAGVLFERAYVPRGQTHPSLASMMTGKYPITTGLRENLYPLPSEHRTVMEYLQEAGFQTGVFIANFEVNHEVEGWVSRGADVAVDGYGGQHRQEVRNQSRYQKVWDDRVEAGALAFLDEVDTSHPFAMWVHFYDVHKPYNPPASHARRYGTGGDVPPVLADPGPDSYEPLEQHLAQITLGTRDVPEAELTRIHGLYDETVAATDDRLGRILDRLEVLGELESTYVVFTSDHGEELYDHHRYFFHGASIYDGVVTVPLIVSGPDLARDLRVSAHVQNIDIAPTLIDLLALPPADDMEGSSLAPLLRGETTEPPAPHAFIEWQDLVYAVTDGHHKLIFNPEHAWPRKSPYGYPGVPPTRGFPIACVEGYDLLADPAEQTNLLEGFDLDGLDMRSGEGLPPEFQPLFEALHRWLVDPRHQTRMSSGVMDEEGLERLKAMGYIGTGAVSGGRRDSVKKDPCLTR